MAKVLIIVTEVLGVSVTTQLWAVKTSAARCRAAGFACRRGDGQAPRCQCGSILLRLRGARTKLLTRPRQLLYL